MVICYSDTEIFGWRWPLEAAQMLDFLRLDENGEEYRILIYILVLGIIVTSACIAQFMFD